MAMTHSGKATASSRRASSDRPSPISLRPSRPMAEALDRLCDDVGAPIEDVMAQAVALLIVAVEGQKKGYDLCLVDDESNVVEEIVNFGILDGNEDVEASPSRDRLGSTLDGLVGRGTHPARETTST
jgi:hypothetical protein